MKKKLIYVLSGFALASLFVLTSCQRKIFTITFEENGGSQVSDIEIPFNEVATAPENPTKEGYTFIGWYLDANHTYKYDFASKVEGSFTLYAKWGVNQYTISFETYGGSSIANKTFDFGSTIELSATPTKVGYEFDGWYTDSSLTEEFTLETMPANDIKLYAGWDAIEYDVTFVSDGVLIDELTQKVEYNTAATLPEEPTKTGYTFAGWYNGEEAYDFSSLIKGKVTLTAKWTINQYELKFDKNNGEEAEVVEYDYSATISAIDSPEKEGYVFVGWYDQTDKLFNFDNASMPASDLVLTAKYEAGTYGIEYKRNNPNASGNVATTVATYDQNATIASNEFTLDGYTFIGWNTAADGTGTSYTEGQEVKNLVSSGNYTLYAIWQANTYTVTFNANGAEGSMENQTFTYDETKSLTANAFNKVGYTFMGWAETATGTIVYGNEDTVTNLLTSGNKTLYAIWQANSYTVTFDSNGAEGSMNSQSFVYDVAEELTANAFNKVGYSFVGWNTSSDGTGTSYTNNQEVTNLATSGSVTLYAQWTINSYHLTIYYNGEADSEKITVAYGTLISAPEKALQVEAQPNFDKWFTYPGNEEFTFGSINMPASDFAIYATYKDQVSITFNTYGGTSVAPINGYVGDAIVAPTVTMVKEGYTFDGWFTTSECDVEFDFENTVMPEGGLTIHAGWTANSYEVEFNSNGGVGEMANQPREYDDNEALTANTFEKEGYTFAGWKTIDNKVVADKEVINLASENNTTVTLFAQWTANTYNVVFDKNSTVATGSMESFEMTVDVPSTLKNNGYSYTGYKLVEWNTASDGSGKGFANGAKIEENLSLENDATVTLYAIWTPITYTIVFNGTDVTLAPQVVTYDKEVALTQINSREGYTFKGWSTTDDGSVAYADKASIKNLTTVDGAKINLFAIWEQITYTVEFYDYNKDIIDSISVAYNSKLTPSDYAKYSDKYTRVGYTFNGWANSSHEIVLSGNEGSNSLTVKSDLALYANYTVNKYLAQFIIDNKIVYETEKEYGAELTFAEYIAYLDERVTISQAFKNNIDSYYTQLFALHSAGNYGSEFGAILTNYYGYLVSADATKAVELAKSYYGGNALGDLVNSVVAAIGSQDITSVLGTLSPQLYSMAQTMADDFGNERAIYKLNDDKPYKENSVFGGWVLGANTQYEQFLEGAPYLDKVPASTSKDSNVVRIKASWAEIDAIAIEHEKNSLTINWTAVDASKYGDNVKVSYQIYHNTATQNILLDTVTTNTYTFNTDPSVEPYYAPGTYNVYVIAVVEVLNASGDSIATLVSKEPTEFTQVTVALKESNLQVDVEGDYYKKGEEDGMETFYFFTSMTYEFSDQNQFTITNYDGEPIESSDFVTVSGDKNNVLITSDLEGYFYFTNSKTPDTVYYAKVLPYTSQFDLGSNLQQFNSALSLSNNQYLDTTENVYQVGVNTLTNTTELVNNGFKFDLTVKTTGGKSIDYKQYKDYLVYKFEVYNEETSKYEEVITTDWSNKAAPWEGLIGTYNYETAAWNFLSSNVGKTYKVTISINDNYVPSILSDKEYGNGKVGQGLIKSKVFTIQLNNGINVFTNADFKKAYADTTLKGGLNIHADIVAELDSDQYYDGTTTSSTNPLNNLYNTDFSAAEAATNLKGTPINATAYNILTRGGKSGNVYQRASSTDLNETYVINGNLFKIDGTGLGYTNVYSYADMSPLADYKIPDTKLTILGYFVSSNVADQTTTTNSRLVVNDLTIISNTGNLGKTQESGGQSAIDRLNKYSGGYHGIYVARGSKAEINNTVVQNANIAVFIDEGSSLEADYLHTMASWYNSIFARHCYDISLDNSYLKDSGGAAIHFADGLSTATNPTPAVVNISSTTKIENFVSGEEAYFKVNSMEITVMQMKTQFHNVLGQLTGGSHSLIQSMIDPTTNLEYQKINFAFLFMPVGANSMGENGADATAYPHVNINAGTSNPQVGLMKSTANVYYKDLVGDGVYPTLVGNNYNSNGYYESCYFVLGSEIPGIGKCVFGSIGYKN